MREKNAASQAEKKAEKIRSTVSRRIRGNIDSSKVSVNPQYDRRLRKYCREPSGRQISIQATGLTPLISPEVIESH